MPEVDALRNYGIGDAVKPIEVTIAAATTIAPTTQLTIVTGTTAVGTVTPPWDGFAGTLDFLFTDASPGATVTTGNIALATTVVSKKVLSLTYSQINKKWYPNY